ncbi:MAG: HAL/PAL/TAL family ammonia-lyase [Campylobacterota bacterium]
MELVISNEDVDCHDIIHATNVRLSDSAAFTEKVGKSHTFLMDEIENGRPIYGITTGYGASGKNFIDAQDVQTLQQNLFRFHGCGIGQNLSYTVCRYMLIIRLVSLSKGKSGVSYELLKRFELLLQEDIIPVVPSQGSVGASGDLTPLSYIAAVIAGEREVYYKGKILPAGQVYKQLGITAYTFKPKEALAVMNGTATMSAIALESMETFETLMASTESYVAAMYELLLCDDTPLAPFVHEAKPFAGQVETAKNIYQKIQGSSLTHGRDDRYDKFFADNDLNIQDNYSLRCAPQVLGVVRDNMAIARQWIQTEINATNDNPLIDGENRLIYTSGNFYGGFIAHAMDTMKIAAANLADLLDKEFALLVDHKFNRGLGENLKLSRQPYYHGFKAMQISMSSLSADVIKNTTAASVHSRPTESLNQDKVSMGTTAALDFAKMMPDLTNMLSIGFIGIAQGVDIRGEANASAFLRHNYEKIRQLVAPLHEDRRLDIDIQKVYTLITAGELQ